jgi:hypothetical protein
MVEIADEELGEKSGMRTSNLEASVNAWSLTGAD